MSREAMQLALQALEGNCTNAAADPEQAANEDAAITALRQALEEKREPLCWTVSTGWVYADYERGFVDGMQHQMKSSVDKAINKQREWVGLTDEEIAELHYEIKVRLMGTYKTEDIYRAIEAKLKERNG